jgi:excisionase family DNA binding protein
MGELLTLVEAAARLRKHPKTVQRWVWSGYLRGKKIGKVWMIDAVDLEAFIATPPPYPPTGARPKATGAHEGEEL